jgi:hypothetical protein
MGMKVAHTADIEADIRALLAQAGWLRRFARALLHNADDAEDLAHDTFATALRQPAVGRRAGLACHRGAQPGGGPLPRRRPSSAARGSRAGNATPAA